MIGHKKTRHGAGWGFHFALLVAASEFMQLKPQIADFQFEGFRRAYVGLKNKKPAPGGLFIQNPGIPG